MHNNNAAFIYKTALSNFNVMFKYKNNYIENIMQITIIKYKRLYKTYYYIKLRFTKNVFMSLFVLSCDKDLFAYANFWGLYFISNVHVQYNFIFPK